MSKSEDKRLEVLEKKGMKKFTFAYIDPASMTHTMFFYDDKLTAYSADGNSLDVDVKKLQQENIVPLK